MESILTAEPSLVGRGQEIEQLRRHFESLSKGKGQNVFIKGEAGVGKTKLVRDFLNQINDTEIKVLYGWCLSGAPIPYFPFIEAFNTYLGALNDEEAKSFISKELEMTGWVEGSPKLVQDPRVPELATAPRNEKDKAFEAAAQVFLQLSAEEPLILFIDDLQWADNLSLTLLHYIARKCRDSKLLIIGNFRSEEVLPDEEKIHPLEETLLTMSREGLATRLELNRLKQNDIPPLLESIYHSAFSGDFIERLHRETEGNPLFLLETLNLLADEGILSEREGIWQLSAPVEALRIPSRVQDVIVRRLSKLGREERDLMDVAAVCGRSFDPDVLRRVLSLDLVHVLKKLVEIERGHKLIRSSDSVFEFTHHNIREVIYGNLQSALRRVYHQSAASSLEQVLAETISNGYIADIAHHYVEGGSPEKAFEYLLKLGEKSRSINANEEAIEYLNLALEATQRDPNLATNENLFKIYKLRGLAISAHEYTGMASQKVLDDFSLMLKAAEDLGDESLIAEAHITIGIEYNPMLGEAEKNIQHNEIGLKYARKTGERFLECFALQHIGSSLIWLKKWDEGRLRLEESMRISQEIGDKGTESRSLITLGEFHKERGEFLQAKHILNRAVTLAEEVDRESIIQPSLWYLSMVLAELGEYDDAISAAEKSLNISRKYEKVSASFILNTLGWIYHHVSDAILAIRYCNESLEYIRKRDKGVGVGSVPYALSVLGMIYLEENRLETAEEYFEEAYSFRDWHSGSSDRLTVRMILGLGEIALRRGDIAKATKFAEESLDISTEIDRGKFIAKSLKLKAEIKAEIGDLSEASELMEEALNLAQKMNTPRLLWQIHNSYGLLLETVGRYKEATKSYGAALALIEMTASKISDSSLRNSLLSTPLTEAIRARVPASAISRISDDDAIRSLAYRLHNLEPGNCYLSESHERCIQAYVGLSMQGVPGLCIVREDPQRLVDNYGIKKEEIVLLSSRAFEDYETLADLQSVSRALAQFLESGEGVVLLDGLEYLISRFGFDAVYSFVHVKRFDILRSKAVLLVPMDMETIEGREKALLSSEFTILE